MAYTAEAARVDAGALLPLLRPLHIPRDGVDRRTNTRLRYSTTAFEETRAVLERYFLAHGPWVHGAVVTLYPQQLLKCHTDHGLEGRTRRHVVLETNPDAWAYHDRAWQRLCLGTVYRVDATRPHGAVNFGTTPRTHLFYDTEDR